MAQFYDSVWWSKELKRMLKGQEPENLHLDYKDKRSLLSPQRGDSISKQVSSFLNSDGGVLIYGVPEDQGSTTTGGAPVPITQSGLIGFQPGEIDKETIENLITSNVQPKPGPELFQIAEVEYKARIVFIIEIAVGLGDVWQAKDKRYYKRFHYKAEPMEHYEINMVRSRGVVPNLKLIFGLGDTWEKQKITHEEVINCTIYIGTQNAATSVVEAALFELWLSEFGSLLPLTLRPFQRYGNHTLKMGSDDYKTVRYELSWPDNGSYRPIFQRVDPMFISDLTFDIDTRLASIAGQPYHTGRFIFWRIQAPKMSAKSGKVGIVMKRNQYAGGIEFNLEEEDGDFEISGEA